MFLLSCALLKPTVAPLPKNAQISDEQVSLTNFNTFSCKYAASGKTCPNEIRQNFEFFVSSFYRREAPYSKQEYNDKNFKNVIDSVTITLNSESTEYDITKINESYTLNVTQKEVIIDADNAFGASRAFATLAQLGSYHNVLVEDTHAYSLYLANITDAPSFPWRQLMIDGARHYLSIEAIKRTIDACAITKFNVLHFHIFDDESFPLKFEQEPQKNLFKGAFAPQYYYSIQDLKELEAYAILRGVVFYVEFEVPGHATSWGAADPEITAHCPTHNNSQLNPISEKTFQYIRGGLEELLDESIFNGQNFKIAPLIHLGGDEVRQACWSEDPVIKKYMTDKNITTAQLWQEFHNRVNDIIQQVAGEKVYKVYWEETWNNKNTMAKNSVIYFWLTDHIKPAVEKGYQVIQSAFWYLPRMNPTNSATHYFWQDTWQDFYKIRIMPNNLTPEQQKLVLGGGPCQWGEFAWGSQNSFESHIWPRSIAVAEVLWSNPSDRSITSEVFKRFEHQSCVLYAKGIKSGPVDYTAPCFGY